MFFVFNLVLGVSFEIQFLAIFLILDLKRKLIDFKIEKLCVLISAFNLVLGASFEIHLLDICLLDCERKSHRF